MTLDTSSVRDIAVLVPSCDKYADIWPYLGESYQKFWPDCPWQKYIISNRQPCNVDGFKSLTVGEDLGWSVGLLKGLEFIQEKYVLIHIEDLILCKLVQTEDLLNKIDRYSDLELNYLRLNPTPPSESQNSLGYIKPHELYRASLVFSIWKKSVLSDLLKEDENPWEFEFNATIRSQEMEGWYSLKEWNLQYENLVVKGFIVPSIENKLRKLGFTALSSRERMPLMRHLIFLFKISVTPILKLPFLKYLRKRYIGMLHGR